MRYTAKFARQQLETINGTLAQLGHGNHLAIQARNGYHGLDLFSNLSGTCRHTVITGTPRRCIDAAKDYLCGVATDYALKLAKGKA